jgi:CheY-like chemotaxis protein/HPt (histidine-containing phosphotransfer) domain-containing protein
MESVSADGKDAERGAVARDRRILVVEDNLVNREVMLAQLSVLGYRGTAVEDGSRAVDAVAGGEYDLVLMDCQMPVMDGFEATQHIREQRSQIPIVAITADAMPADRDRCLQAGMSDYLAKPVELKRLSRMLERWLPARAPGAGASLPAGSAGEPQKATVFNQDAVLQRLMGDRRLAGAILRSFVTDCPSQLNGLRQRIAARDGAGACAQAHSLNGAAATAGAEALQALAVAIERACGDGELRRCAELLPHAVREFDRFRSAIEDAGWASDKDKQ